MNGAPHLLDLTIVIYAFLIAVFAWIVHMIRRSPHPVIPWRAHLRKTGKNR